jgi:hypothetical protein
MLSRAFAARAACAATGALRLPPAPCLDLSVTATLSASPPSAAWPARLALVRLLAALLASLALHLVVLSIAQRQLDFELPPPAATPSTELFVLPAPIALQQPVAAAPRRAARAISAAPRPADRPIVEPDPGAVGPVEPAPDAPPASQQQAPAQEAAPADLAEAHDEPASAAAVPLDAVVVNFPKYGRLTSDTLAARGLLRLLGTTVIEWRVRQDRYEARSETRDDSGTLWLTLVSEGEVRPSTGIAPVRYTEKRANRAEVATNFQWDAGKVTFSATAAEYPLLEGVQDQLSFLAQLAVLAEAFPQHFVPGGSIAMQVASRRDVRVYDMRVIGWEMLNTRAGVYDTLKLERAVGPEARETRMELWLAPALRWLPARTRMTLPNGDLIDTRLSEASFDEPPPRQ